MPGEEFSMSGVDTGGEKSPGGGGAVEDGLRLGLTSGLELQKGDTE